MNIISLRKFIWSFTRLKDLESAYRTLQHMVDLSIKEGTFLRRTVEGKIYCPQLDIPIPSGSVMSVMGFDPHKDQLASPVSPDGEELIMNTSEGSADNNIDGSTKIELLDDHRKGPIKKILRWSFNDVIHACGHCRKAELAQQLIVQVKNTLLFHIVVSWW